MILKEEEEVIKVPLNASEAINGTETDEMDTNKLVKQILENDHFDSEIYQQLSELLLSNPLLIEDKIKQIFSKILFMEKITNEEKNNYKTLLLDILDASVSLRREIKLISWILVDFKENSLNNSDKIILDEIFPDEFIEKFSTIIYNLTHKQINDVFISFLFHFELISKESTLDDDLNVWVGAVIRLMTGFLQGVHIFDYSAPLYQQQKFISVLVKLGNVLVKLIQMIDHQNEVQLVFQHLLEIIKSWETVVAFLKHYAPQSLTEEHLKSLSNVLESMKTRVDDLSDKFQDKMINRMLISCRYEMDKVSDNCPSADDKIVRDIKKYWMFLFEEYPNVISQLETPHYFILAPFLINNFHSSKKKGSKLYISSDVVQENESFILAIVFSAFSSIDSKLDTDSLSKRLINQMANNQDLWEKEKIKKVLKIVEATLVDPVWVQHQDSDFKYLKKYLEVFLHLPLIDLNNKLRNIIFVIAFTVYSECKESEEIRDLCLKIFSDVAEYGGVHILKFFPLELFADELPKHSVILKSFQNSIKAEPNYESIERFMKVNKHANHPAIPVLLDSFHKVKSHLKDEKKKAALKVEKKLFKQVLKTLDGDITTGEQLKNLEIVLKVAISLKKLDDSLTSKIHSTIDFILKENCEEKDSKDASFKEESLNFLRTIFLCRGNIAINKDILKPVWMLMLRNPCETITSILVEMKCDELFKKILVSLNKQTVKAVDEGDETVFSNSMKVWQILASQLRIQYSLIIQQHLETLTQHFLTINLTSNQHLNILQLFVIVIKTRRIPISEGIIDLIFIFADESISQYQTDVHICEKLAEICISFVKCRSEIMSDRLPAVISLYKRVLEFIVNESKKDEVSDLHPIQCLSLDTLKIATALVKMKKDMIRISPYVIADIVAFYSDGVIPSQIKDSLDNCIFTFLSICDQHAIPFLCRTLPAAVQQIFKNLYETYNKFYKFTGKI